MERETRDNIIITEMPLIQVGDLDIIISVGHHRLTVSSREKHGGRIGKKDWQVSPLRQEIMIERKNTIVERDGRHVNPNQVQALFLFSLNIMVTLLPSCRVQLPLPSSQINTRCSPCMIRVVTVMDRIPLERVKEQIQSIEEEIKDVTRGNNVHMNPLHPYHPGQDQARVKRMAASQMMLDTDLAMQVTVWN